MKRLRYIGTLLLSGLFALSLVIQPVCIYADTQNATLGQSAQDSSLDDAFDEVKQEVEADTEATDSSAVESEDTSTERSDSSETTDSVNTDEKVSVQSYPKLTYVAHVAKIGWQGNGVTFEASKDSADSPSYSPFAGTTGRSLSIEALKASIENADASGSVLMRAHVQNVGWQGWQAGQAGTTGKSQRIEAIELKLDGDIAQYYDIYYRVHSAGIGWMGWTKNGAPAGTSGQSKGIEAIQIRLVQKNGAAPTLGTAAFRGASETLQGTATSLSGSSASSANKTSILLGNENGAALQSYSVKVNNLLNDGSISYAAYRQFEGWSAFRSDGAQIDPANNGHIVKGVKFQLSGSLSSVYDIWYRVHDVSRGWSGWASNGAAAGIISSASAGANAIQLQLTAKGSSAPGSVDNALTDASPTEESIVYQAHVANKGWMNSVSDGATAGTSGNGLALQALNVTLAGPVQGSVSVKVHVSNKGWLDAKCAPQFAGTVGQGLAMQAVSLSLNGDAAQQFDVYYRLHVANYGWLGWAKNGDVAGTTGLDRQAEAIQIKLVKKGSSGPSSDTPAYISTSLSAQAHVQNIGWMSPVSNGQVFGTSGQSKRIEAFKLSLPGNSVGGSITYSAHVQNIGWQNWVSDGEIAGTTGKGYRVEAIKVKLTGNVSKYFDVWYRVHVQNYGWMGWTSNGNQAGTSGISYRIEAIQVKILPKGAKAPGSTGRPFTNKAVNRLPADQQAMLNVANRYSSRTNWLLLINNAACRVGVYQGSRGNWRQVAYWLCSPGKPSTPTVRGEYTVTGRGYSFGHGYTCYYYTQFYGNYLFHSVLYDQGTFRVQDGRLGQQLSHGCVRLDINNAKWIYQNIPNGTKVVSY